MENYLSLLGVLIVILGFAFKLDSILIVMVALVVTAFTGGLGLEGMLETLGTSFVNNRGMAIFIIIMLATGTLERNGLKESAATLIKRFKKVSAGMIIDIYGVFRMIFAAFNVSFGGVAGFVRPIIMPMALGTVESKGLTVNPEHEEELKGMSSAMENICWFFGQVLFIGGAGALLVQSTLKDLGYEVTLGQLALVQIPVAITALVVASVYFYLKEKKLAKKYYSGKEK
ncbi:MULTISPECIES: DUF969 domain-containing protein [Enterococcus]|uniref:DUF969 domain-containing protein n=2 Tax=Enterococcus mundtii TaxID=53346 RepID=A0A1A6G6J7_ENTMU|nr:MULTISPECIES: DUF969 domain-containing protein [Enterococcus]GEN19773.1 membrane protein [Ligilactobacillus acidipiscis]AUB53413.1 hypothetical protein EM4838_10535 [Enterococcus mundtii]AZP93399.1 DUF969 domain-containing protein [Enterococcus mundtii]MBE9909832.1 DUF969 domain-containing protein [Enterococcus mundtii]MBO1084862.1 DUF969 domain-containing protein [Enterococcus mundtii]